MAYVILIMLKNIQLDSEKKSMLRHKVYCIENDTVIHMNKH